MQSIYKHISTHERTNTATLVKDIVESPKIVEKAEEASAPTVSLTTAVAPIVETACGGFSSIQESNSLVLSVVDNLEKYVEYVVASIKQNISNNKAELEILKEKIILDMHEFEAKIKSLLS